MKKYYRVCNKETLQGLVSSGARLKRNKDN
jgi:hypothetical protein